MDEDAQIASIRYEHHRKKYALTLQKIDCERERLIRLRGGGPSDRIESTLPTQPSLVNARLKYSAFRPRKRQQGGGSCTTIPSPCSGAGGKVLDTDFHSLAAQFEKKHFRKLNRMNASKRC